MKNYLIEKTSTLNKGRSKLAKRFGIYWFQKMSEKEWNEKKSDVFVEAENIHSE